MLERHLTNVSGKDGVKFYVCNIVARKKYNIKFVSMNVVFKTT